jgi:DNA-binding transcriptional LysR family regulator
MVSIKNDLLLAFDRVTELKTVHAAAQDLGLTQAAITKRIRLLESQLGITLFLRSRRGMVLTEEGKAVLQYSRRISEAEGELIANIAGDSRQEVSVIVVGPTSFVSTRLADACSGIYERFPFLRLHLRSEDHANRIELIRRGEADLAIVNPSKVPNEMSSKLLRPDRYLLVGTPKWKGRSLEQILKAERIIDFYESDSTTMDYLSRYGLEKYVGRSRLFVNENDALVRYFMAGVGFGTLTEPIAKPYLERGDLIRLNHGKAYEESLALVWYGRSKQISYFEEIVRSIK